MVETHLSYEDIEAQINQYRATVQSNIHATVIRDRLNRRLILLCSVPDDSEEALSGLEQSLIHLNGGKEVTIGRSEVHPSVEDISSAYLEALSALAFKFVKGRGCSIPYREIKNTSFEHNKKLTQCTERILRALATKDVQGIQSCPDELVSVLSSESAPLYQVKKAVNEVINGSIKLCVDYGVSYQQFISVNYDFSRGAALETLENVAEALRTISDQIAFRLLEKERDDEGKIVQAIWNYVNENALDHDFSVDVVAGRFGMSYSHLCKLFRQYHHTTILNVKNEQRLEKAKELLAKTELSIQKVALAVGYDNVASFIRKFKKQSGMTPMNFRKSMKEGK